MIPIEVGSVFAGKYRLDRALAQGGMGSVWVARHMQLDVDVAIEIMDPTFAASPEARGRFEREAKAAAKLQSPHVVQVYDYGVEDTTPYIVMELLVGEDLGDRLKRENRLSLKATADIVTPTAKALRRAHEAGIVHRDLKPGNIFLARHQDELIVKVLDFGIAKAIVAPVGEVTKTGTLIGSPHYMSPEQARSGKNLDHRSDIWSLGVIVFRALTGALPFPGDELGEVFMAICADPIPTPSQIAPDLGPAVDQFFARALSRDTTKRFQSARDFAEAFASLSEGASALAPRWTLEGMSELSTPKEHPSSDLGSLAVPQALSARPTAIEDSIAFKPQQGEIGNLEVTNLSGSLAPARDTVFGLPKGGGRTAVIATAIVSGVLALSFVSYVVSRPKAPVPTATTATVTMIAAAESTTAPPPPLPMLTAPTPTVAPVLAAAPPATASATPRAAPTVAGPLKGSLKKGKDPAPAAKPPADKGGNPLLGF